MIVCSKAYFLKDDIELKELKKYGFITYNNGLSYSRDLSESWLDRIVCYDDSRVFKKKALTYVWSVKVKKYIQDLIDAGLVYEKKYYYVIAWNCRNWSDKKEKRVLKKVNQLQEKADKKFKESIK